MDLLLQVELAAQGEEFPIARLHQLWSSNKQQTTNLAATDLNINHLLVALQLVQWALDF